TALAIAPAAVSAQEAGQTGITFGTPSGLGLIYHMNDQFAIRPELSFASTSSDTVDLTTWTAGVSGIFYTGRWDALRTYLSPRLAYGHTSPFTSATISSGTSNYQIAGAFGAQYALHRRFGVYGEVGLTFTHTTTSTTTLGVTVDSGSNGVSTRSS